MMKAHEDHEDQEQESGDTKRRVENVRKGSLVRCDSRNSLVLSRKIDRNTTFFLHVYRSL